MYQPQTIDTNPLDYGETWCAARLLQYSTGNVYSKGAPPLTLIVIAVVRT